MESIIEKLKREQLKYSLAMAAIHGKNKLTFDNVHKQWIREPHLEEPTEHLLSISNKHAVNYSLYLDQMTDKDIERLLECSLDLIFPIYQLVVNGIVVRDSIQWYFLTLCSAQKKITMEYLPDLVTDIRMAYYHFYQGHSEDFEQDLILMFFETLRSYNPKKKPFVKFNGYAIKAYPRRVATYLINDPRRRDVYVAKKMSYKFDKEDIEFIPAELNYERDMLEAEADKILEVYKNEYCRRINRTCSAGYFPQEISNPNTQGIEPRKIINREPKFNISSRYPADLL